MLVFKAAMPLGILALGACASGPINATSDSRANMLEVGMTPAEVTAIIGPSQFGAHASNVPDQSCLSYVYDEAIDVKFVHVTYQDGKLISASDGHRKVCGA